MTYLIRRGTEFAYDHELGTDIDLCYLSIGGNLGRGESWDVLMRVSEFIVAEENRRSIYQCCCPHPNKVVSILAI